MIRKVSGVVLACGLFALTVSAADFQTYSFAAGRFKAAFPGKPKVQTQPAPGGLSVRIVSLEQADRAYAVMYSDLRTPVNEPDAKIQERLDAAVRGAVAGIGGGTVTRQSRIWLSGKYPGRDFQVNITKPKAGVIRGQVYLVGTRLYQVLLVGTSAAATSPDADLFLKSFALTK